MPERIPATEITASAVGRRLREFSHLGEEPAERDRTDRIGVGLDLGVGVIIAVRTEDVDNTVAVLLGEFHTEWARDEAGRVLEIDGRRHRVPTIPPTATIEIGFGPDGWVELADEDA